MKVKIRKNFTHKGVAYSTGDVVEYVDDLKVLEDRGYYHEAGKNDVLSVDAKTLAKQVETLQKEVEKLKEDLDYRDQYLSEKQKEIDELKKSINSKVAKNESDSKTTDKL